MLRLLRNEIATGLVLLAPVVGTAYLIVWLIRTLDGFFPDAWRPDVFGRPLPGVGILIALILATVFGMLAHNFVGQWLVTFFDSVFGKMPLFGGTYGLLKQVTESVFSKTGQSFQRAVLVEFPTPGSYAIGFLTSELPMPFTGKSGAELISVFVPTTPNPTSGFYLLVERNRTRDLEMSIADAFKLVLSMGIAKEPDFLTTTAKLRMPPPGQN